MTPLPDKLSINTRLRLDGLRATVTGTRAKRRGMASPFVGERFYVLSVEAYSVSGWAMPAHDLIVTREDIVADGWEMEG